MIDLGALTPAERRLLPGGRLEGPAPYVIAIMMFVMVVIAAAGLAIAHTAAVVSEGIKSRYSVQMTGGTPGPAKAVEIISAIDGIRSARPVAKDEMRDTLERWLGPDSASADLPLPTIVDVDLAPGANADQAQLTAHAASLKPVLDALRALGWLALALVALIALATAAAVVLATRGTLDTQRPTIEVMHGVGATDEQVARLFQRKIALDALVGGTVGAVAAGIVLLLIAGGGSTWLADLFGGALLGQADILLLSSLPLIGTILAAIVARYAVLKALRTNL
jgi:cell division transport system permease protein